jgi:hypothetical protein
METLGLRITADAGGLISAFSASKQSAHELEKAIEAAQKAGDTGKVGELSFIKDRNQAAMFAMQKDFKAMTSNPMYQSVMDKQTSGQTLSAGEQKLSESFHTLTDKVIKLTEQMAEAAAKGDTQAMRELTPQIETARKEIGGLATSGEAGGISELAKKFFGPGGVNGLSAAMFASAGMQYAQTVHRQGDKSSLINSLGSGDGMSYAIEQQQREQELKGVAGKQAGTAIAGGIAAGLTYATGGAAGFFAPTIISMGGEIGKMAGEWGNQEEINRLKNIDAKSKAWEQFAPDVSNLNKLINPDTGDSGRNHKNIMDTFDMITGTLEEANSSATASEAMEAMGRVIKEGMAVNPSATVANVLKFHEGTGVDVGELAGTAARFERFGNDKNALAVGYQGLQASGLQKGQYQEFLQGMQKVFEDGMAKGIIKGSQEIAGDMSFLAQMSGNSALWQGEQGAARLMGMNNAIANSTGLSSVTDILTFRAAQNPKDKDYVDTMITVEKGFTPDLLKKQMELFNTAEGGDRPGVVERIRQAYGFNYTTAAKFLDDYNKKGANMSEADIKKYTDNPGSYDSQEKQVEVLTRLIQTDTAKISAWSLDAKIDALKAVLEGVGEGGEVGKMTRRQAVGAFSKSASENDPKGMQAAQTQISAAATGQLNFSGITYDLFDTRLNGGNKRDIDDARSIEKTLTSGIKTGHGAEYESAIEMGNIFRRFQELAPKEFREKMDKENVFNQLAGIETSKEMLAAIRLLVAGMNGLAGEIKDGVLQVAD